MLTDDKNESLPHRTDSESEVFDLTDLQSTLKTTTVQNVFILIIPISYIRRYRGSVLEPPCPSTCICGKPEVGRAHLPTVPLHEPSWHQ